MSNLFEVKVPDLGGSSAVPVIEILVSNGDSIALDAVLLVLESDKATMEVPAPKAGIVRNLRVAIGQTLSMGDVICELELLGAAAPAAIPAPLVATAPLPPAPPLAAQGEEQRQHSAPPMAVPAQPAPEAQVAAPIAAPVPVAASVASSVTVRIPDLGSFTQVPVIEVLVANGQHIEKDAAMLVLESDKSTMEVPAPASGIVQGLAIAVGQKVSPGDVISQLQVATGDVSSPAPAAAPVAAQPPAVFTAPAPSPAAVQAVLAQAALPPAPLATPPPSASAHSGAQHAGPATRKFARELGVDLAQVSGNGAHGRITVEDVQAFVKARMQQPSAAQPAALVAQGTGIPAIPAQDFSQFGPIEHKPLARIRKLSAAHLSRAWLNVPHVTQNEGADITELEAFRKAINEEGGSKLTLLPFLMKAVGQAMRAYPEFNSSLAPAGDALIVKGYCNLGFAADTDAGLVVPVVKDVWSKSISQLASECSELAKKARDGKLKPDDMRGGCFSISSLGGLGVTGHFTPIVNAPEVAILGVSKATLQPVWDGKGFAPRLMLPLSLSYDHRVIDGAYAARFTVALAKVLADVRRLVL